MINMQSISGLASHVRKQSDNSDNSDNGDRNPYDANNFFQLLYSTVLFTLPFFYLPFTFDLVSVNKTFLVLFGAGLAMVLFFAVSLRQKRLRLRSLDAYFPIMLLLSGFIIATIFSVNKRLSIWGFNGAYSSSLMFYMGLAILGFVAANVRLKIEQLSSAFVTGVTVATLISFLFYFNLPLPGVGPAIKGFSTAGGPYVLAGLQVVAILTSVFYLFVSSKRIAKLNFITLVASAVICATYILTSPDMVSLGVLFVGSAYVLFIGLSRNKANLNRGLLTGMISAIVLLTFLHYFPVTQKILGVAPGQQPARLPITESWLVSASTLRDFPLAGSGLGTFSLDFTRYRPASLNASDNLWQSRFLYPFNDVFLFIATAGLIGIAAYLLFWVLVLKNVMSLDNKNENNMFLTLLFVSSFAILILLGHNPVLYALVFIFVGILGQRKNFSIFQVDNLSPAAGSVLLAVLGIAPMVYFGINGARIYRGQLAFRQSLLQNNLAERFAFQQRAVNADPYEDVYRRNFVITTLEIASILSQVEDPTETDTAQIQELVSSAVLETRRLTELTNPLDVNNWQVRGLVYESLIGAAENAAGFAVNGYTNAINLEPTNPNLWIALGGIYYKQADYANAIQAFARSVQLKNDLANAHYNLAFALKEAGDPITAVTQLEIVARLVPEGSEAAQKIQTDLEEFRKLAEDLRARIAQQQAQANQQELPLEGQTPEEAPIPGTVTEPFTGPEEEGEFQIEESVPEETLEPPLETTDQEAPDEEAPLAQPPVN